MMVSDLVSDDFFPAATGVGIHLQIICKELVLQGHEVLVLTSRQGQQKPLENWEGVQVHRCLSVKIAGFYQAIPNLFRVIKIIREHDIEIVHFHYLSFMLALVSWAIKNLPVKKVYTNHMTAEHLTQTWFLRPFRGLVQAAIIRFLGSVDTIICPSSRLKDRIAAQGVLTPMHFLTNPVAKDFFQRKSPEAIRKFPFQILYVGRLNPEKNVPLLLKAFAEHLRVSPESRLWIVGKGDQERHLKSLAAELRISNHVDFLGFMPQKELSVYYNSCDVFVLPSIVEAQPLVVMEAMSFAKPTIVTREMVSAEELVDHDGSGFIVDALEPGDLTRRLNSLAASEALRDRLGRAGRIKIKACDPQVVTGRLVQVYAALHLGSGPSRTSISVKPPGPGSLRPDSNSTVTGR